MNTAKISSLLIKFILIILAGTLISCGSSSKETRAEQKKKEVQKQLEYKEAQDSIINKLSDNYHAIYFPPDNFPSYPFTYDVQMFFANKMQTNFIFEAYLEDIEQTPRGLVVEFLCPFKGTYWENKRAVRFRLSITSDSLNLINGVKNKLIESLPFSARYMRGPDFYVVASIDNVEKIRIYRFEKDLRGEEAEIEPDLYRSIMITGKFIDAVIIQ